MPTDVIQVGVALFSSLLSNIFYYVRMGLRGENELKFECDTTLLINVNLCRFIVPNVISIVPPHLPHKDLEKH